MKIPAALVLVALVATGARAGPEAPTAPLVSTRSLLAKLRAAGRAEASVRLERRDPLSGRTTVVRGRLALELPHFARLDLGDGQRLTLREDGGDWLQPATRQLVRAGARSAAGLLAWWGALLDPRGGGLRERKTGLREYVLLAPGAEEATAQRMELGADGLPRRVVVAPSPEESIEYRIVRWRFASPRGRAGFVLETPPGFELVELP
jgi:hypothetical protein